MTMFGISEAVVAPLIRQLGGDDGGLDSDQIRDRFACAVWSGLGEPGDRVAGALVAGAGAAVTLDAVIAGRTALQLADLARGSVSPEDCAAALARWMPRLSTAVSLIPLQRAAGCGVTLLVPGDRNWPRGVNDLREHAPVALWVRGSASALHGLRRSIALVGARAATGYGEHVAMEASAGLVDRGYTIVSGAAYGIDGMAHRAALASHGSTVAFLAGGVDRFYPSGHDALLTRIVETGAVVSELPCGSQPTKWRFLQRNRLIAASSVATVVLEAGWRSGSLNTAGHAATLGRPLGAVPGPVTSAASAGCHRLIRDFDAVCVTNADEMAELAPIPGTSSTSPASSEAALPAETIRVLDALSLRAPRISDDVARRSGLSVATVQAVLGPLELDSIVRNSERGWVRVR